MVDQRADQARVVASPEKPSGIVDSECSMWRKAAIRSMLLEDLCSLRPAAGVERDESTATALDRALQKARRRGVLVVALDWLALAVLFLLRGQDGPWLTLGPTEEAVFTIGVLIVAVHSGFRLAQLQKLRHVSQLIDELDARSPEG